MVTYGPGKPAVWGRPYLEKIREACRSELEGSPPGRIIVIGIRPAASRSTLARTIRRGWAFAV